ncbi:MAG TPA: S9 family peptidase [Myxococcaceae bacterium]|nr:S9 family peptidase [Myxococcaceae bacterium]
MLTAAALLLLAAAPAADGAPHPFTTQDLISFHRVSDPEVSPDGKQVVFAVSELNLEENRRRSDLWMAGVDGRGLKHLTTSPASDTQGRWAPDGRSVYFLSGRQGDTSQVWRIPVDGGEAEQVTRLPGDVNAFAVFPDGKRLLVAMDVFPDLPAATTLDATAKREEEQRKSKVKARGYDKLLFRHWDEWEDGKRSHLFVVTPGSAAAPVDLMAGMEVDCPPKPFGGSEAFDVSPDGNEVAFTGHALTRDAAWSTDLNVYVVPASGKSPPRSITSDNRAADGTPLYSPDGTMLVYLAMKRPGAEADRRRIVVVDRKTMKARVLTEGWDRSPGDLAFSPDSKTLYVTAEQMGNNALFTVDVAGGQVTTLWEKGNADSPRAAGDRVVFSLDTLKMPAELRSISRVAGGALENVTSLNAERLRAVQMGDYEQFSFKGAKDETVHGYVMKPANFRAGQKYPVAFLIHGGPEGSFGDHFHYRWNPQSYAGAGYAVVFIDFHGSTGYGQAFTDSIAKDWGGAPFEDLMKGLDAALAKYPFLDGSRVGALGASYGGYMINWIAGHTDRFKALVCHDGIFDTRAAYFETEELWFAEWDMGGTPWDNPEAFSKFNPVEYVKNWKTPMLVIHGSLDYRLPETQGMGAFTALQRRGIPSRYVSFPDENHWVLKPQNSLRWHQEVLGWLDQWVKAPKRAPLAEAKAREIRSAAASGSASP